MKKIGHTGTLDPLATGGLLVATWNYTKLISYVEKDSKSYLAHIALDGTSPSYDSDTEVSFISKADYQQASKKLTQEIIEDIFQKHFLWKIKQIPPKYSALKINGKRALDRTLAGEEVIMKQRDAEILSYKIHTFSYPQLIVEITVTAGTYIRSIAYDLWQILTTGWYLTALRRTGVGHLSTEHLVSLESLTSASQLELPQVFPDKIIVFQDEQVYKRLADGQRVWIDLDLPKNIDIFLFDGEKIRFVVEYRDSVLHPRKKVT